MSDSLVLHMTFMMTRVVVVFLCLSLFVLLSDCSLCRTWRRSWRLFPKKTRS
jgi:hypothetical protein